MEVRHHRRSPRPLRFRIPIRHSLSRMNCLHADKFMEVVTGAPLVKNCESDVQYKNEDGPNIANAGTRSRIAGARCMKGVGARSREGGGLRTRSSPGMASLSEEGPVKAEMSAGTGPGGPHRTGGGHFHLPLDSPQDNRTGPVTPRRQGLECQACTLLGRGARAQSPPPSCAQPVGGPGSSRCAALPLLPGDSLILAQLALCIICHGCSRLPPPASHHIISHLDPCHHHPPADVSSTSPSPSGRPSDGFWGYPISNIHPGRGRGADTADGSRCGIRNCVKDVDNLRKMLRRPPSGRRVRNSCVRIARLADGLESFSWTPVSSPYDF